MKKTVSVKLSDKIRATIKDNSKERAILFSDWLKIAIAKELKALGLLQKE